MGELFVYDNTNGMWLNNHTAYLNIIKQHKHFLHLMVKDEKKSVWIMSETKSYGNCRKFNVCRIQFNKKFP